MTTLEINEATILLVRAVLRDNGKTDATVEDAVIAIESAVKGLTK